MSWNTPLPEFHPNTTPQVPGILSSSPAVSFAGARSVVKNVPSANGGETLGPLSTFSCLIQPSPNGFIVPNSMYLHCRVKLNLINPTGAWAFAGQHDILVKPSATSFEDPSPGSSILDRIDVVFPNGSTMTYNNYGIFSWGVTCSHVLPREYVKSDLKELMQCHTTRVASGALTEANQSAVIAIPLHLPIFNSQSAFPLCLMTSPIEIRFFTASLESAFTGISENASTYTVHEIHLVYEELQVSPTFKSNFVNQIASIPYTIPVKDYAFLGLTDGTITTRTNIGVGLSSLNSVFVLTTGPITSYTSQKSAPVCGLVRWNLYVDNQRVNQVELDDSVICFAELNRALGTFNNGNRAANVRDIGQSSSDGRRTSYTAGQFLLGFSTSVYNDTTFTVSGIPAREIAIELERSATTNPVKFPRNGIVEGCQSRFFIVYDTLCQVSVDGNVTLRR